MHEPIMLSGKVHTVTVHAGQKSDVIQVTLSQESGHNRLKRALIKSASVIKSQKRAQTQKFLK